MKSFISKVLVLVSTLILVSCQNDLNETLNNGLDIPKTKSSLSVPSVLSQLDGIPVNIKLKSGNQNYSYLSANKKSNQVDLNSIDDGSLRQRWLIGQNGGSISVEGGAYSNGHIYPDTGKGNFNPMITNLGFVSAFLQEGQVESTYYICALIPDLSSIYGETYYLYSVDAVNRGLLFGKENKTRGRNLWEIIPVETFEIIDVKYAQEVTDRVEPSLQFIRAYNLNNINGPSPLTHSFDVSEEFTESSTFGKTEGLTTTSKISNSASFNIGLPFIKGDGKVDTELTTQKSWTYSEGKTVTNKKIIKDTFGYTVPPYTNIRINLNLMVYDLNVTYIITLKGNESDRIIKLKGKWEGVEATVFTYEPKVVQGNTNQVLPKVQGKLNNSDFEQMYINK